MSINILMLSHSNEVNNVEHILVNEQLVSIRLQVEEAWATLEFPVIAHKESRDVFVLGGVEELQAALDESTVHVTTILSSRNCGPLRSRVEEWQRNLELFAKTLVRNNIISKHYALY